MITLLEKETYPRTNSNLPNPKRGPKQGREEAKSGGALVLKKKKKNPLPYVSSVVKISI
jgi:hypothetical protein